jgi:hypothetical protein
MTVNLTGRDDWALLHNPSTEDALQERGFASSIMLTITTNATIPLPKRRKNHLLFLVDFNGLKLVNHEIT